MRLPYCFSFLLVSHGQIALLDDAELDARTCHKWYSDDEGYVVRNAPRGNGKRGKIRLHNDIMRPGEGMEVDHTNHQPLDNRKQNMENVTHQENCLRRRSLGVHYDAKRGQYRYRRTVNGKRVGGWKKTKRAAVRAVNQLKKQVLNLN